MTDSGIASTDGILRGKRRKMERKRKSMAKRYAEGIKHLLLAGFESAWSWGPYLELCR